MQTLITPTTLHEFVLRAVVAALEQLDLPAELAQQIDVSAALEEATHQINTQDTYTVPAVQLSTSIPPDIRRMVRVLARQRIALAARRTIPRG